MNSPVKSLTCIRFTGNWSTLMNPENTHYNTRLSTCINKNQRVRAYRAELTLSSAFQNDNSEIINIFYEDFLFLYARILFPKPLIV